MAGARHNLEAIERAIAEGSTPATPAERSEVSGVERPSSCGHTEGPHHDCAYVDARNGYLDQAEAEVNRELGPVGLLDPAAKRERWGRLFLRVMTGLTQ